MSNAVSIRDGLSSEGGIKLITTADQQLVTFELREIFLVKIKMEVSVLGRRGVLLKMSSLEDFQDSGNQLFLLGVETTFWIPTRDRK